MKQSPLIIALMSMTIVGCASNKTMFYKDGQQVHVLSCSGPTFTGCLEKASQICQTAGYDILDRASVRQSGFISSSDYKELIVSCRTKPLETTTNTNTIAPVSAETKQESTSSPTNNPATTEATSK